MKRAEGIPLLARGECRLRRQAPDRQNQDAPLTFTIGTAAAIGAEASTATNFRRVRAIRIFAAATFFALAMLAYLLGGVLFLVFAPPATTQFAQHRIPSDAKCLRADRRADYTLVELGLGSPVTSMSLLFRPDKVVERTVNASNAKIFSARVAESESVACDGTVCSDAALLQRNGPNSQQDRVVIRFEYMTSETAVSEARTAYTLGADGELALEDNYDYFLTATHLCWSETADAVETSSAVRASASTGYLLTNATLFTTREFRDTPIAQAATMGSCSTSALTDVQLFPVEAGRGNAWLGLQTATAYESSLDGVQDRRVVVELGTECASTYAVYQRPFSLYQLDCLSSAIPCETDPSVPFRRLADTSLRIQTTTNEAFVWATRDSRLAGLPNLLNPEDAFALSIVKLLLMSLVAAVVWIRASKITSSASRLFVFCLRGAHCHPHDEPEVHEKTISEDALVGFLAIVARLGLALWRVDGLTDDRQGRLVWIQVGASLMSLVQWATRYFILERQCESPLTKLGGSTALVDAPTAVMLAFAEPPLLVTGIGRFDPTARLLTGLLLVMTSMTRCLFAAACCGVLWSVASSETRAEAEQTRFSPAYAPILFVSGISWILQAASIGMILADSFVYPLAYSMARSLHGDWSALPFSLFLALTASSLPQLLKLVERLAEANPKTD